LAHTRADFCNWALKWKSLPWDLCKEACIIHEVNIYNPPASKHQMAQHMADTLDDKIRSEGSTSFGWRDRLRPTMNWVNSRWNTRRLFQEELTKQTSSPIQKSRAQCRIEKM
jgi:hypothetical protein